MSTCLFKDQYWNVFVCARNFTKMNCTIDASSLKQEQKEIKCESLSIQFFYRAISIPRKVYTVWLSHHDFICLWYDTGKSIASRVARLPCMLYIFLPSACGGNMFFGGMKLIEWWGDIQRDCWRDTNRNTQYATNAEKVMGRRCLDGCLVGWKQKKKRKKINKSGGKVEREGPQHSNGRLGSSFLSWGESDRD